MNFKPIKTKKVYEEIIDQVKNMIYQGVLNPKDKLVTERELANRLGVGRSAVREAYSALEAMGIIEIKHGEGAFIKTVSTESLAKVLSFACLLDKGTPEELIELRKILEVESAGLASRRYKSGELDRMEQVTPHEK